VIRYEVWIGEWNDRENEPLIDWRFNACFDDRARALKEIEWYTKHKYVTDLRMRTTRYQRHEHMTTGKK